MKKLITASALIALLISPAFAQKNAKRTQVNEQARAAQASGASQAQTDNGVNGGANGEVVWGGRVRAQDPDPFIRGSILRGMGNYGGN
jgi:hypothetical protein